MRIVYFPNVLNAWAAIASASARQKDIPFSIDVYLYFCIVIRYSF